MKRIKVEVLGLGIKFGIYTLHQKPNETDNQTVKRHMGNHVNIIRVLE